MSDSTSKTQYSTVEETFDAYAETYEKKFNHNPLANYQRQMVHETILPYLRSAGRILDVGCGPGSDFDLYKSLNLDVDAIDISPRMVELASHKSIEIGLNANIQVSSLEHFRTAQKYPLVILNFGVVNSISDLDLAADKLKRLLEEKGFVIICSMPPVHFFSILEMMGRSRFQAAMSRIFRRKVTLNKHLFVYYYNMKDFSKYFVVKKKINLGALLPTPDQYHSWKAARIYSRLMLAVDRRLGPFLPDFWGGDHVCYVMQSKP